MTISSSSRDEEEFMTDDLEEQETRDDETPAAEPEEEVFTGTEAGKLLGITNVKLSRYIEDLRLYIPRDKKSLRITRADLELLRTYHRNRADGPRFRETQEAREFSEALKEYGRIFRSLRQLSTGPGAPRRLEQTDHAPVSQGGGLMQMAPSLAFPPNPRYPPLSFTLLFFFFL